MRDLRRVLVDPWMLLPTPRLLEQPMFAPLRAWLGQQAPASVDGVEPAQLAVQALEAAGGEVGLIAGWHAPEGEAASNDEVAAAARASAGRLLPVASVDVRRPVQAIRELRRAVEELGARALRIQPWAWGLPPSDRLFYPLLTACVEAGIPFLTQVGHAGPLRASEPGRPIPYLDQVALDFPELTIVAGHIGAPWTEEMLSLARKYERVHIATSAYAAHRYPPELISYMQSRGGRRKVLFGSGFPVLTPARALERLDELDLDEEARELFLTDNARRVFALAQTP
jgi:predicted TIM-barrel fold metal-dependent hydrolase